MCGIHLGEYRQIISQHKSQHSHVCCVWADRVYTSVQRPFFFILLYTDSDSSMYHSKCWGIRIQKRFRPLLPGATPNICQHYRIDDMLLFVCKLMEIFWSCRGLSRDVTHTHTHAHTCWRTKDTKLASRTQWVMSLTWMTNVTYMNESCHIYCKQCWIMLNNKSSRNLFNNV